MRLTLLAGGQTSGTAVCMLFAPQEEGTNHSPVGFFQSNIGYRAQLECGPGLRHQHVCLLVNFEHDLFAQRLLDSTLSCKDSTGTIAYSAQVTVANNTDTRYVYCTFSSQPNLDSFRYLAA